MHSRSVNINIYMLTVAILTGVAASAFSLAFVMHQSAGAAESAQATPQQWEFLKFDLSTEVNREFLTGAYASYDEAGSAAIARLLSLGNEGWELIDVEYYETGDAHLGYTVNEVFFFQRPIGPSYPSPMPSPTSRPTIISPTVTPLKGDGESVQKPTETSFPMLESSLLPPLPVITATPNDPSLGIPVPSGTSLATLDPAILPPMPTDLPPAQPTATPMDDGCLRHVVVAGEGPSIIAARYGVFVGDLLRANGLNENSIINANQVLIVPVPGCNALNAQMPIPSATLPPTAVNAGVTITGVLSPGEINSEAVELHNRGDVINMQGWVLRNTHGDIFFRFPEVRFQPGAIMRIFTRQGLNTPAVLYWGRDTAAWLVGDQVILMDAAGEVQATFLIEAAQ